MSARTKHAMMLHYAIALDIPSSLYIRYITSVATQYQAHLNKGWSGGAMVLGRPTIWITVGQGPSALAVGARGGCLDIFTLVYPFFPLSPSLWV